MAETQNTQETTAATGSLAGRAAKRLAAILARPLFASPGGTPPKTAADAAKRPGSKIANLLKKRIIGYPLILLTFASLGWVDNYVADQKPAWQYSQTALGQDMAEAQAFLNEQTGWNSHVVILDSEAVENSAKNNSADELAAAIGLQMADRFPVRVHFAKKLTGSYQDAAQHLIDNSPVATNSHVPGFSWGFMPSTGRSDWGILGAMTEKVSIVVINPDVEKFAQEPLGSFGNIFGGQYQIKGGIDHDLMRQFIIWHEVGHGLDHNQHFDKDRSAEMRSESFGDAFSAIETIRRHGPQPEFFEKLVGLRVTGAYALVSEQPEHGLVHYTAPVLQAAVEKATALYESGALASMDLRQRLQLSLDLVNEFSPSEAELIRMSDIISTMTDRYDSNTTLTYYEPQGQIHQLLADEVAASRDAQDTTQVKFFFQKNADFRMGSLEKKPRPGQTPAPRGM